MEHSYLVKYYNSVNKLKLCPMYLSQTFSKVKLKQWMSHQKWDLLSRKKKHILLPALLKKMQAKTFVCLSICNAQTLFHQMRVLLLIWFSVLRILKTESHFTSQMRKKIKYNPSLSHRNDTFFYRGITLISVGERRPPTAGITCFSCLFQIL